MIARVLRLEESRGVLIEEALVIEQALGLAAQHFLRLLVGLQQWVRVFIRVGFELLFLLSGLPPLAEIHQLLFILFEFPILNFLLAERVIFFQGEQFRRSPEQINIAARVYCLLLIIAGLSPALRRRYRVWYLGQSAAVDNSRVVVPVLLTGAAHTISHNY